MQTVSLGVCLGLLVSLPLGTVAVKSVDPVDSVVQTGATAQVGDPTTNGLTRNETATLFSGDVDQLSFENVTNETATETLSRLSDFAFATPPETAHHWSAGAFERVRAGGATESVAPADATLSNDRFLKDAHVSVFGVHPTTWVHADDGEPVRHIAPNGTVRALVDYRVHEPEDSGDPGLNATRRVFRVRDHGVESVRLTAVRDGEEILLDETTGQTPSLVYDLTDEVGGPVTLAVEADITVTVQRYRERGVCWPWGNETVCSWETVDSDLLTETLTVQDDVNAELYQLNVSASTVTYPDGDRGVATFYSAPWQGLSVEGSDDPEVRGVWRFYTARDQTWDELSVRSVDGADSRVTLPEERPVAVHAYPSRIGPRVTDPATLEIVQVWGLEQPSPESAMDPNVNVGVVTEPYTASYGVATRIGVGTSNETAETQAVVATGIVSGVEARGVTSTAAVRELRESELSATVLEDAEEPLRVRLELTDASDNTPIGLDLGVEDPRYDRITGPDRDGTIEIAGQSVQTNDTGVVIVEVPEAGVYEARYEPGSWLTHDPAYTASTATVRAHPLTELGGWLTAFAVTLGQAVPFLAVGFLAWRAGLILRRWP
ncbi:hypothetical protein [Salinirubrum litoreum]|uniref:Uncharacterized protein n=1 Tax=Salinirubrum litoreum TaxID=1126234 RepID=A0ABD5RBB3_9EURY|nr:hypothetical protein [Salinirubrum litoreum]